jgi:cell wall assembly regulator SMI1
VTSLTYEETFPPAPASRLEELEQRLGARLPEPYRAYLGRQDGGALEGYNNHGIEIILGIGEVPRWSSLWYLLDKESDVLPEGFIPVGRRRRRSVPVGRSRGRPRLGLASEQ